MSVDGERAKRRRLNNGGSALRRSTRQTSYNPAVRGAVMSDLSSYDEILVKSAGRRTTVAALKGKLRSRTGSAKEDEDELSGDSDSSDFVPVYSDLLVGKPGRPGKGMKRPHPDSRQKPAFEGDDDIEYKTRRSGRSTRTRACMVDSLADEEMYAEDDKAPTAPRIASVKEVFQSLPANNEFRKFHMQVCDTCARGPNVGQFVYCQGCSATYHRACLGSRSTRDHLVTKIGEDNFVLQCRHCINITKATRKPDLSPARDMCQICREKGASCRPFSERLKPKEEERLRLENNGVDPITHVDEKLINNAETLLFRCVACHRGYHFEHLPTLPGIDDDRVDRQAKLTQYSRNWRCADCFEMIRKGRRVQTLVAWRPARPEDYKGEHYDDIAEDVKEYLIKWQGESYFHCTWLPGAWVWGVVPAAARKAFAKRAENAFPKMTSKEAIPEEYLLIDIVFRVQYKASSKGPRGSKEADFSRITDIKRAYVKFEGLGYDEAVWDTPPPRDSGEQWLAWEAAFADYLSGKYFESEPSHKIKERIKQYRSEKDFKNLELREQPKGLTAGNLMKYQLLGVNWMLNKFYLEKSAILADEMGLGKTIQVIGLIASLVQDNPKVWSA